MLAVAVTADGGIGRAGLHGLSVHALKVDFADFPMALPAGGRDVPVKALSGPHTLRVGLAWWAFGMCMAFTYFVIVSRMLRGKVSLESGGYGH